MMREAEDRTGVKKGLSRKALKIVLSRIKHNH